MRVCNKHSYLQDDDEEEEDDHRVCHQQRVTPSPGPPERIATPPPPHQAPPSSPSPAPAGQYICLFPESTPTTSCTTPTISCATPPLNHHTSQDSYDQEVGVVSTSYEEEIDASLMDHHTSSDFKTDHTHSLENEFAELDPYLSTPPPTDFDPEGSTPALEAGVEVGVDIGSGGEGAEQEEESASPLESVLYSHSHY